MGGLRWTPIRGRPNLEDRRFDPPAIRDVADGVDGRRAMTRCDRCKRGQVPERILVTIQTVHVIPPKDYQVVLTCPWCRNRLTRTSANTLSHATVTLYRYEDTAGDEP